MNEHKIQLIRAGFKVIIKFLTLYILTKEAQNSDYFYATLDIRDELEEIVNKL